MPRRRPGASLSARPTSKVTESLVGPGIHPLGLGDDVRDGRLYVPKGFSESALPLLVLLHGAGGDASSMLRLVGPNDIAKRCVLLAPEARLHTWDFLIDNFGPDVVFLNRALEQTFRRCHIKPSRIALAGFSDGASYALSVGLANGDLFTHVIAFAPGFMRPPRTEGTPKIFLSHGTKDRVLPIDRCSRYIVPQLERLGYDLTYREFEGPHTVPAPILQEAMQWFTDAPNGEAAEGPLSTMLEQ